MTLDERTIERISAAGWEEIRPLFEELSRALLSTSGSAKGELTTIYVKYTADETRGKPFAVIWLRKARLIVGIALPENVASSHFVEMPKGCKYAGLTKYLEFRVGDKTPAEFSEWSRIAFDRIREQQ